MWANRCNHHLFYNFSSFCNSYISLPSNQAGYIFTLQNIKTYPFCTFCGNYLFLMRSTWFSHMRCKHFIRCFCKSIFWIIDCSGKILCNITKTVKKILLEIIGSPDLFIWSLYGLCPKTGNNSSNSIQTFHANSKDKRKRDLCF